MPFGAERSGMLGRMENERLVDQLTRQREQDTEWKRMQTQAIEDAVKAGSMTWQEGLDRIAETWNDHKPNREFLKEHAENVQGIHGLFDKVKHILFPPPPSNPLGTGTYAPPPSAKPRVPASVNPVAAPTSSTTQTSVSFSPAVGSTDTLLGTPSWLQQKPNMSRQYERTATNRQTGHKIGLSMGKWYDTITGEEMQPSGLGGM